MRGNGGGCLGDERVSIIKILRPFMNSAPRRRGGWMGVGRLPPTPLASCWCAEWQSHGAYPPHPSQGIPPPSPCRTTKPAAQSQQRTKYKSHIIQHGSSLLQANAPLPLPRPTMPAFLKQRPLCGAPVQLLEGIERDYSGQGPP